jgi:hypothetical protein
LLDRVRNRVNGARGGVGTDCSGAGAGVCGCSDGFGMLFVFGVQDDLCYVCSKKKAEKSPVSLALIRVVSREAVGRRHEL